MKHAFVDQEEIKKAIQRGDSVSGRWMLVVSPTGETKISWAENTRAWDPWQKNDDVFAIPALFPDGSGRESEEAEECIRTYGDLDAAKALCEKEGWSEVDYCERKLSDEWAEWQQEGIRHEAEEFLMALNDEGSSFYAWIDSNGKEGQRRFQFEWQEDRSLQDVAEIVAEIEGSAQETVVQRLHARRRAGTLTTYLKQVLVRPADGKHGKIRMIHGGDVVKLIREVEGKVL